MLHSTASDTEFTILQTLKLILMEVIQVSDSHAELVKERAAATAERAAAAAERAAASEERRIAAAERQAICTSLDRMWMHLSKSPVRGGHLEQGRSLIQQTTQPKQPESTLLVAAVNPCHWQDGTYTQKQEIADGVAIVADAFSRNKIVERINIRAAETTASTALQVLDEAALVCNFCQGNCEDNIEKVQHTPAVKHQTPIKSNGILPEGEIIMVDLLFAIQDKLSQPSDGRSSPWQARHSAQSSQMFHAK